MRINGMLRATWLGIAVLRLAACGGAAENGDARAGAPLPPAAAGNADLGVITATVSGRSHTWHVVAGSARGRPYSSGAWMQLGPDERAITLGGYDTPTPPIETFEYDGDQPASFGEYSGSLINLTIPVWPGRVPFTVRFPVDEIGVMASVLYMPRATFDPTQMYEVIEGVLEVTRLEVRSGLMSVEGTFSGRFERHGGDAPVTISDGRFRAHELPDLKQLAR